MKWISVEDKLPKLYCYGESDEGSYSWEDAEGDALGGVTHWCKLPKLPKGAL